MALLYKCPAAMAVAISRSSSCLSHLNRLAVVGVITRQRTELFGVNRNQLLLAPLAISRWARRARTVRVLPTRNPMSDAAFNCFILRRSNNNERVRQLRACGSQNSLSQGSINALKFNKVAVGDEKVRVISAGATVAQRQHVRSRLVLVGCFVQAKVSREIGFPSRPEKLFQIRPNSGNASGGRQLRAGQVRPWNFVFQCLKQARALFCDLFWWFRSADPIRPCFWVRFALVPWFNARSKLRLFSVWVVPPRVTRWLPLGRDGWNQCAAPAGTWKSWERKALFPLLASVPSVLICGHT